MRYLRSLRVCCESNPSSRILCVRGLWNFCSVSHVSSPAIIILKKRQRMVHADLLGRLSMIKISSKYSYWGFGADFYPIAGLGAFCHFGNACCSVREAFSALLRFVVRKFDFLPDSRCFKKLQQSFKFSQKNSEKLVCWRWFLRLYEKFLV